MAHEHGHADAGAGDRRLGIAIAANLVLTGAQLAGGLLAGSLALVADAVHNFSDVASLLVAYGARRIARRPADQGMTFGYGRAEVVAALINYTTLIVIGLFLIYEGAMRLIDPPGVAGWYVVILGGVALAVDALTAAMTWSMRRQSVNIRALFLHNLSDALSSIAVVVGGLLILLYDLRWADPAITILIAAYILYLAAAESGATIRILMLASPPGIAPEAVLDMIAAAEGVAGLHHVHFWQIDEHEAALDAHLVIADAHWGEAQEIKDAIKARLAAEFGIHHATLDLEKASRQHVGARRYGH